MKILVVEDQAKMAQLLKTNLMELGYDIDLAEEGKKAEVLAKEQNYDLVILDVMLPDQTGFETARHLREASFTGPILMLTALSTTKDKVTGLDAGADDYLTKPYSFEELSARVRALLRRQAQIGGQIKNLKYKDLELDILNRRALREGQSIQLTAKEFALLEFFLKNPEKPLSRQEIAAQVWGTHFDSESNVIDVYINILRKKIDSPFSKRFINTVVGIGYVLKENP
ncbi:MAG: response regulator transcription factor [Bdellovibrionia bacterium]